MALQTKSGRINNTAQNGPWITEVSMKKILWLALLALGYHGSVWADYEDGVAAAKAGHFQQAIEQWQPLAQQGDAQAQTSLALLYLTGHGVPQDDTAAMGWFRKAAEQGYAKAQYNLAYMYANGRGDWQNFRLAIEWFRKAAEQQHADAQLNLGLMYADGEGVAQDYAQAEKWYRLAAEQGNASALTNLGALYYRGQGVKQDKTTAYMLFCLAAANGDESGEKNRELLAKSLSPEQLQQAQTVIAAWKPGSALPK